MAVRIVKGIWTNCRNISRKIEKRYEHDFSVAHNNIPEGSTVTYSCIVVGARPQK